jgi:hypothetical protein
MKSALEIFAKDLLSTPNFGPHLLAVALPLTDSLQGSYEVGGRIGALSRHAFVDLGWLHCAYCYCSGLALAMIHTISTLQCSTLFPRDI